MKGYSDDFFEDPKALELSITSGWIDHVVINGVSVDRKELIAVLEGMGRRESERIVKKMEKLQKLECHNCIIFKECPDGADKHPCRMLMDDLEAKAQDAQEVEQVRMLDVWLNHEVSKDDS
jgi:hypothetical protein